MNAALAADDPRAAIHAFLDTFFDWFSDPDEQRRRRVNVYVWAEALHSPGVAEIVAAGIAPIDEVVVAIRAAARDGRFPEHVDPEGFARSVLALIQGFVLQQAWDPGVDVDTFRVTARAMIDAYLDAPAPDPRRAALVRSE